MIRHPDPGRRQLVAAGGEDCGGQPVGDHATARLQHDQPVDQVHRLRHSVLDQQHRQLAAAGEPGKGLAHEPCAFGIEVGGRLVKEEEAGPQRERRGKRQPLLFSAREGVRGALPAVGETNHLERLVHARPDLDRRNASVLEAERDLVTGSRHHQARLRILEDDPGPITSGAWVESVDLELPLRFAALEQAGQPEEEGRLP